MKQNITTLRSTHEAIASDLEHLNKLAALAADLREGRGCVIMTGPCAVSIGKRAGQMVVVPGNLLEVQRYTKEGAVSRVSSLPNIAAFRVVPFSAAISLQQTAMEASLKSVAARINQVMGV